jgi:hypothetical protein
MGSDREPERLPLREFLERAESGHLFRVEFTKRTTGEHRVMVCRRGVKKGVKGIGMSYKPEEKNLFVVFDMMKRDPKTNERGVFRMINLDGLTALRFEHKDYSWDAESVSWIERTD